MQPWKAWAATVIAAGLAATPAAACSAYSCDGVGWQTYDPRKPGVMQAFQEARRKGTQEALDAFVRDYPGSPAASWALDLEAKMTDSTAKAGDSTGRASAGRSSRVTPGAAPSDATRPPSP